MPLSTGQVERDRKPLGTETVGSGHDTGCLCVVGMSTAHCAAVKAQFLLLLVNFILNKHFNQGEAGSCAHLILF